MGFKLEKVVPWGRSLDEYIQMFNLTPRDRALNILDCAAGPASFNGEMTRQGHAVTSCDPIYQFTTEQISQRIEETYPVILDRVAANSADYIWSAIASPEALGQVRMSAMQQFLEDFDRGLQQGRYVPAELPALPFRSGEFDLALCGHFLFSYSQHLSTEFHLQAIAELCRVASEVRIFPTIDISGEPSPHLNPAIAELQREGYQIEIQPCSYVFQRGADRCLRITR